MERPIGSGHFRYHQEVVIMAMYLGNKKVAVTNTVEKQVPSMKAYFEAGGKCQNSNATSFEGCWQYDDTINITKMYATFLNCSHLIKIPPLNTSNVTNMNYMFQMCSALETVPQLDFSKVDSANGMFQNCTSLKIVPRFDISNTTSLVSMLSGCSSLEAIHMININANLDISSSTKFTREALLEIIGNLKAQTSGTKTLTIGSTNLAKLTDEDKTIATNKGWTLA